MKSNVKNILMKLALAILFVAMVGTLLVNVNLNTASAAGTFSMGGGAEIMTINDTNETYADDNGMRFTSTLTKEYDDAIKTDFPGATTNYYTLIATTGINVADLTEDKVNGSTIIKKGWTNLSFDDAGKYVYNVRIVNLPENAYRHEITVRSYVKITKADGTTEIRYASGTDSKRSMEGLANIALYSADDDFDTFEALGAYVGGGEIITNENASYLDIDKDAEVVLDGIVAEVERPTVYVGARKVAATINENGQVVLSKEYLASIVFNNSYLLTVLDGTNVYRGFITVLDEVIKVRTATDFVSYINLVNKNTISGTGATSKPANAYALVLENNIDMTGVTLPAFASNTAASGIIDGQGYTISNLDLKGPMFYTTINLIVQNVAFEAVTGTGYMWNNTSPTSNTSFDNCYIDYASTATNSQIWHIGGLLKDVTNTVIVNDVTATSNIHVFRASTPSGTVENVIAISMNNNGEATELNGGANVTNSGSYVMMEDAFMDVDVYVFDENYWYVDDIEYIIEWVGREGVVYEEITHDETIIVDNNAKEDLVVDLINYGVDPTAIAEVKLNGAVITEYTFADDTLTIENALLGTGTGNVQVITDSMIITVNYEARITYKIGNEAQWIEFVTALKTSGSARIYAELTNSFTYTGGNWVDSPVGLGTTVHTFTLDGKGHTINGVVGRQGMFPYGEDLVIKNIGFTNGTVDGTNARGFFAWTSSKISFENVYLHGDMSNVTGANYGVFGYATQNMTFNKVLQDVDMAEGKYASSHQDWTATQTDMFVYAPDTVDYATNGVPEGLSYYTDADTYLADAENIVAGLGEEYWEVIDGVPMWKTAAQFFTKVNEVTISVPSATMDGDVAGVFPGTYEVETTPKTTLSLKSAVAGVSISGSDVVVDSSVASGTEFTVVATYVDPVWFSTITVEQKFAVLDAITVQGTAQEVGINRATSYVTMDLAEYDDFSSANILSITFNDVAVTGALIEDSVLKVPASSLTYGEGEVVAVIDNGGMVYKATIPVTAWDFIIGNETEFKAWLNAFAGTSRISGNRAGKNGVLYQVYAVLDNDITLTETYGCASGYADGMLDGRGHSITGARLSSTGFIDFYTVFEIKNIAFVDLVNTRTSGNAYALFNGGYVSLTMSNMYIEYTTASTGSIGFNNNASYYHMTNVIYKLSAPNAATKHAFRSGKPAEANNVFVFCADTGAQLDGKATANSATYGLFADEEAFKTAVTDLSSFNNEYWDITSGVPVWSTLA